MIGTRKKNGKREWFACFPARNHKVLAFGSSLILLYVSEPADVSDH